MSELKLQRSLYDIMRHVTDMMSDKISTEYGLEELVETIKSQWDNDEIFELIKKLDEELGSLEFTEKLYDYFDLMYNIDMAYIKEY